MLYALTDIPQADRIEKVVAAVNAVSEGANTDVKIAAAIGFSDRQGRYYRHAAEILGFIINNRNNATITEFGLELINIDLQKKFSILRKAIYRNNFFKKILEYFSTQKEVSEQQLEQYVYSITETDAHSTIPRRIKTILSWFLTLDLIDEDENSYQLNQKTYSQNFSDPDAYAKAAFSDYYLGVSNKTLQKIEISNITPNPHNPRLVFDPHELDELKTSIDRVGILVPLTVYRNSRSYPKTEYVLLDGERRWRCAKELNHIDVPANVIDEPKDITQNILFMFNIHHFKKEWALFPTALKLEIIIQNIGTENEKILSEFTGVSTVTIRRCKALLWYPEKYRGVLLEKEGKISTDFFIELFPIAYRLSQDEQYSFPTGIEVFVDGCVKKFIEQKHISDVKEFREMRKSMGFFDKINNFQVFLEKVQVFLSEDIGLEIFQSTDISDDRYKNNLLKYLTYLNANLGAVNIDFISDFVIEDQLRSLNQKISKILDSID